MGTTYSNDTANVAKGNLVGGADGAAVVAAEIHVEPAHNDGHSRVGTASDEEEGAIFDVRVGMDAEQHGKAGNGNCNGD